MFYSTINEYNTDQRALHGEREVVLQVNQHDEGEKADHIDEAAAQPGDVSLVEEGADQEADGEDAEAVVTQVEEDHKAVAVREDAARFQNDGEDGDSDHKEPGALNEPGKEVADGIDAHHFHVLVEKNSCLKYNKPR